MKKQTLPIVIISIIILLVIMVIVWYRSPIAFLANRIPIDIEHIEVFDGTTGKQFTITDRDEIEHILHNIQSQTFSRGKISSGYNGFSFSMSFYAYDTVLIDSFIINSDTTIRKDPFFYHCGGSLCYDYLAELRDKYTD